ncbi:MAG: family 20 glycosylhydrolase [Deltaproteobacteria bacterium]|jgi:hypothetical protein|nr:family 20 glycosylhydrolase [Deltaproteobacteria bacterium]MBW2495798.1 family 20 glycosylhydrolase [Deltaproteobacteria bacterium]
MGARRSDRGTGRAASVAALLPAPKQLSPRRGELQLSAELAIELPASPEPLDRRLLVAARTTRDEIEARCGMRLAIERPGRLASPARGPAIRCELDRRAAPAPRAKTAGDAYQLKIRASGAEIRAPSVHGLRHGLQTLSQLVTARGRVPALDVSDQPDFRDRGLMLDVSRGKVPSRATLAALVDLCSRLRLNVLMLYVEHTFAFRRHPEIGEGASPLDAETILWLDAYAHDRGVELLPCLQSLGHMERILSLERYAGLAETDRRWSLSPTVPATYALLDDLYDEFLPLFRSKRFNANCDEPYDLGRGRSAARAERRGRGGLFAEHVEKLRRMALRHDKRLMIWADFAYQNSEHIDSLGRDVVLLDWWYEAEFDADRIRGLRRRGFEVWACPGTSSWNAFFPRVENAAGNIARWAEAGRRHGASGLLVTDWGDFGHYNALGVSLHGYAWSAQQAWSGDLSRSDFERAFARRVFGEESPRIAAIYRRLGAIHDAGYRIFNGCGLQHLYFDTLERGFFLGHAGRPALERSLSRLQAVQAEIDALALGQAGDDFVGLAGREIHWAASATRLAAEKGLASLDYDAWRAQPGQLRAPGRRALARRLEAIARTQQSQLEELRTLWLARSPISEFEITRRRIRRSIASLRRAARRLREDRPPRPATRRELTLTNVAAELRRVTAR